MNLTTFIEGIIKNIGLQFETHKSGEKYIALITENKLCQALQEAYLQGQQDKEREIREKVEGKMKELWGKSDIVNDGKNEPYIAYKGGMYSTDGFIEELMTEVLALLTALEDKNKDHE